MKFSNTALLTLVACTAPTAVQGFAVVPPMTSCSGRRAGGGPVLETSLRSSTDTVPSLAQTHMQGPLTVTGSGAALTKEELDEVKKELEDIKLKYDLKEPERSFMTDSDIKWKFGGAPDYSLTNLFYLKERSVQHAEGSLEQIVENLVKTWEMERSHKTDPGQHMSVDQEKFRIQANGGKIFDNISANEVGNYNVLLDACPAEAWDSENISWDDSHEIFHKAFAAFPWEVLEVFSGPPKVAFSWRHWATFTGTFEGNQGEGQLVEMFGFGTAVVNDKLQLQDVDIYYDANEFLDVMRGNKKVEDTNKMWQSNNGCPFTAMMGGSAAAAPAELPPTSPKSSGLRSRIKTKIMSVLSL